jgi:hypothetical protein
LLTGISFDLSRPNVAPRLNILAFDFGLLLLALTWCP